jgi:hypothetical protein
MSFEDRFLLADSFLTHMDPIMGGIGDDFIRSRYSGFLAVAAVTAYELALKDIIYAFADKKHKALGELARSKFDRLNGQIKLGDVKDRHIACFGPRYAEQFAKEVAKEEAAALAAKEGSIKSSYGNIVTWRHSFVHEGTWPNTVTYSDLRKAYEHGKRVIRCASRALVR